MISINEYVYAKIDRIYSDKKILNSWILYDPGFSDFTINIGEVTIGRISNAMNGTIFLLIQSVSGDMKKYPITNKYVTTIEEGEANINLRNILEDDGYLIEDKNNLTMDDLFADDMVAGYCVEYQYCYLFQMGGVRFEIRDGYPTIINVLSGDEISYEMYFRGEKLNQRLCFSNYGVYWLGFSFYTAVDGYGFIDRLLNELTISGEAPTLSEETCSNIITTLVDIGDISLIFGQDYRWQQDERKKYIYNLIFNVDNREYHEDLLIALTKNLHNVKAKAEMLNPELARFIAEREM